MRITWTVIAGNVLVVQTALIAASSLYYAHRGRPASWWPWWSLVLIAVTAFVTGAQFIFPEVLPALRRDLDGLRDGQWWRVVTPLFVQPGGIGQVLSNALFLLTFVPLAEKLYGRGMLVLYFTAGLLVQIDRYYCQQPGRRRHPSAPRDDEFLESRAEVRCRYPNCRSAGAGPRRDTGRAPAHART